MIYVVAKRGSESYMVSDIPRPGEQSMVRVVVLGSRDVSDARPMAMFLARGYWDILPAPEAPTSDILALVGG